MNNNTGVFLSSMPFAGTAIPSIQLSILEGYLKERNIRVETSHLFLKAAEVYGLNNYNFLISHHNNSYDAQMVFSSYVFPDHWKNKKDEVRSYYKEKMSKKDVDFGFDEYLEKTDVFFNWVLKSIRWDDFGFVGFSLNYGQLLPSLAIAKRLKEKHPEIRVVFGGSRCVGELGVNFLKYFDYLDFVVSGDGEESLYQLASGEKVDSIPGLIYRKNQKVCWNKNDNNVDLNNLSVPVFDSFYQDLSLCDDSIKQYFMLYGRLPVEISRGCWWNRCSFCNLNLQHQIYREKSVDKIVEEIRFLSDRYKILDFQIIGNTLPKHNHQELLEKIKKLGKDFSFFAEARAGRLKFKDYKLLKEAGFTNIQTGVESFSSSYLKKMNKGTRVIDNIAALKFCKEFGLKNSYNIITGFPNEEKNDFMETQNNTRFFKQFIDPPNLSPLIVGFGSPIFCKPENFNVESFEFTESDHLMVPQDLLDEGTCFYYRFKKLKNLEEDNDWKSFLEDWQKTREEFDKQALDKKDAVHRLVFFMVDGGSFLKIYDKRDGENVRIYVLDELERKILLSCVDVVSFEELKNRFSDLEEFKLAAVLHTFEKKGIVFHENGFYLCLPLISQKVKNSLIDENTVEASKVECLT